MDRDSLEAAARDGLQGLFDAGLADITRWCLDWCEASGDGRYCSLAFTFRQLDEWSGSHEERGGIPTAVHIQIDEAVRTYVRDILHAESAQDGAVLARSFRQTMEALMTGPGEWERDGLIRPTAEN